MDSMLVSFLFLLSLAGWMHYVCWQFFALKFFVNVTITRQDAFRACACPTFEVGKIIILHPLDTLVNACWISWVNVKTLFKTLQGGCWRKYRSTQRARNFFYENAIPSEDLIILPINSNKKNFWHNFDLVTTENSPFLRDETFCDIIIWILNRSHLLSLL